MPEPILEVRDLTVHFYTYAGIVKAIEKVSFDVYKGETFALVGETGCGKSVTSRALTQLIESPGRIVGGKVIYHSDKGPIDLLKLNEEEIRKIRGKEIAYIFQDPHASLDPLYRVGHQIAEAMVVHETVRDWKEGIKRALDILKRVLIPDPENRVKNYPHEMSGGMKQRVVIGTGLANNPKILIADEPTTALDVTVQAQILDLMNRLKRDYNTTLILITHNMGVVAEMADRIAVMYAGKIAEIGTAEQIFKNPLHPYTQGLLKAVPNPMKKIERLDAIPGTVPNLITPPSGCRFHPRCPFAMERCKQEVPELKEVEPGHFVACHLY
ncbi:ABC transporter ATP-binding protein [Palaeococcus ferrophilus]|uniref:ABC transporter ATP-binding protein n=1 Tax=Palaeococcus ferrophilus TaxID=83868 RepID=UPI00064F219D|nr:ABC transporter ATP-binding protein [Palaeococcus ferrophilus]